MRWAICTGITHEVGDRTRAAHDHSLACCDADPGISPQIAIEARKPVEIATNARKCNDFALVVRTQPVILKRGGEALMHTSTSEQEATALLHAAERSLFDATSRLEQALAALGKGGAQLEKETPGLLDQVRLYSGLIQARLDRLARPVTSKAA